MTVSGYPSQPTFTLATAVAVAASSLSATYTVNCVGRRFAVIGVLCDKSHDVYFQGAGPATSTPGQLWDTLGNRMQKTAIAGGASWDYFMIEVGALSQVGVVLLNNDAGLAATISVDITLV